MNRNEDAVSPVIGVILMVAITVILAAVIAAFVFSMTPPQKAPQASIRLETNNTIAGNIDIRHSGGDIVFWSQTVVTLEGTGTLIPTFPNNLSVGNKMLIATGASGEVRVIGTDKASQQIIFDTKIRV